MLKCFPDKYETQKICGKAADFCLITLKIVPDWLVTNKMLEKLGVSIFSNDDIFFHDADFNNNTFLSDDVGFNTIDLNNINLDDDDNFDKDDPESTGQVRLMAWHNRFKQRKLCTRNYNKILGLVHYRRWEKN